jgi:c-di-GMP-binding flagellar brake protein YcgR
VTEDKRKHKRYKIDSKLEYAPVDDPSKINEADIIDISFGGIGIKLAKLLKGRPDLNIKITHKATGVTLDGRGKVVWQKGTTEEERRAGIEFIYVALSELKKVLKHISPEEEDEEEDD